jgi:hypothetical protein
MIVIQAYRSTSETPGGKTLQNSWPIYKGKINSGVFLKWATSPKPFITFRHELKRSIESTDKISWHFNVPFTLDSAFQMKLVMGFSCLPDIYSSSHKKVLAAKV